MECRYYGGLALKKDLEFCNIVKDLCKNKDLFILKTGGRAIVHEMKDGKDTGRIHTGYAYHYIDFIYKGYYISINPSTYYPFTDENIPGKWNFMLSKILSPIKRSQCSYLEKYEIITDIDNYIESHPYIDVISTSCEQLIDYEIHYKIWREICAIIYKEAGFREREVMKNMFCIKGSTWNDDHKVVDCLNIWPEPDGYRSGFQVDLVTKSICG